MSYTTLSNKIVVTKKPRRCFGCNTVYPVGSKMNKNFSVDGRDISSTYWCAICETFMSDKWKDIEGEGVQQGDCWEYREYEEFRNNYKK